MPDIYGIIKNNTWYGKDDGTAYYYCGKTYKVSYDGEIYNSVELKIELIEKGYNFSTYLEEELVLKAYIEWDFECLNKFSGVFSIVIWNVEERKLFLARDFIGIKSLYYSKLKDGIIFSDRVDRILKNTDIKANTTYDKICELFLFEPYNNNKDIVFSNINILLPSNFLIYKNEIELFNYRKNINISKRNVDKDVITEIRGIITESVIRHIIPDTDIFTMLFDGIGNILNTVIASDILKELNEKLTTVSLNKTKETQKVIEFFNTKNINIEDEMNINDVYHILDIKEFPDSLDLSSYYLVFKNVGKYANIGITGANVEQIFNGNASFLKDNFLDKKMFLLNESFLNNVNKDFLVDRFAEVKDSERLKLRLFISNILSTYEKTAKSFNITLRNPFFSKELIEYVMSLNDDELKPEILHEIFQGFVPNKNMMLPKGRNRCYYNEYIKLLINEYRHILDNPTSKVHEIIDKNKAYDIKSIKLMKLIVEFDRWLKEFNIDII